MYTSPVRYTIAMRPRNVLSVLMSPTISILDTQALQDTPYFAWVLS